MYYSYCEKYTEAQKLFENEKEIYQIAKTEFDLEQMFYKPVQR